EIVSAITEEGIDKIRKLHAYNWDRSLQPFERKYLIGICSDEPFHEKPDLNSVVFQVNKDYLQLTSRLVDMDKQIQELGAWGQGLDKVIAEKDEAVANRDKTIASQNALIETLQQQAADNQSVIQEQKQKIHTLYQELEK